MVPKSGRLKTNGQIFSSPALKDDIIYVGSNDKHMYALNAKDGAVVWKTDLGGAVFASPTVTEKSIYTGSSRRAYVCS